MKKILIFFSIFFLFAALSKAENKNPKELIEKMTEVTGNYENLKSLKDVEYTNTVTDTASGKSDISVEKYIFDGELSWAEYSRSYTGI